MASCRIAKVRKASTFARSHVQYVVYVREGKRWTTWRLPCETFEDALQLVREYGEQNIDRCGSIELRVRQHVVWE